MLGRAARSMAGALALFRSMRSDVCMMNRRAFCVSLAAALPAAFGQQRSSPGESLVYFGTYTRGKSKGIYVSRFTASDGKLSPPELAAEANNPSFVALHPKGLFLYAVSETNTFQDQKTGSVSAFSIDPATGKLKLLNQLSSRGQGPCHLVVDRTGKNLLVANYSSGSVACFPLKPDGSMAESSAFIQHTGSGPNRSRQQAPHAHQVVLSPDNRFAFVPDLGMDSVMIYRFDPAKGTLTPHDPPSAKTAPGSGPRHMAFHPKGRFAYVLGEIANSVTAYSYDAAKGSFTELQTVTTLPKDFTGNSSTAEIEVHPNGRFLYGSNRGHDSITRYSIDAAKGTLTYVDTVPTQGNSPRCFSIDPSGRFLIAVNERSDNAVGFQIDPKTGGLTPTGQTLEVGAPVSLQYLSQR
jgi:6-phosphogluconolactonase